MHLSMPKILLWPVIGTKWQKCDTTGQQHADGYFKVRFVSCIVTQQAVFQTTQEDSL